MLTFSTEEVVDILNIPYDAVKSWVKKGILTPIQKGGRGAGFSHRFSLIQIVGLSVAWELYQRDVFGCTLAGLGYIVDCFAKKDEEWLEAKFTEKKTAYCRTHHGLPVARLPGIRLARCREASCEGTGSNRRTLCCAWLIQKRRDPRAAGWQAICDANGSLGETYVPH